MIDDYDALVARLFNDPPAAGVLEVTYTDGTSETFRNVRYPDNMDSLKPLLVFGDTLSFETTEDRIIYRMGVRGFEFLT